ncbi:hypothetical protein EXS54_01985 [Patescibacteria group bacterium]|nr:hypothetical protein [Patescibacteria group bacterium]
MLNPFDITIQNQADDEEIIKVWRHHPFTLIKPVLKVAAFLLVPLALFVITGPSMFTSPVLFVLFLLIIAMSGTFAAFQWVSWYGDVYVLTNYRIVDVEQDGFFHRNFSETMLNNIQDISHEVSGVPQTVFNYGNVLVQTAGSIANISLDDIGNPQEQSVYLLKHQQRYLEKNDDEMSAEKLLKLLAKHGNQLDKIAEMEKDEQRQANQEQQAKAQEAKPGKKKK